MTTFCPVTSSLWGSGDGACDPQFQGIISGISVGSVSPCSHFPTPAQGQLEELSSPMTSPHLFQNL